ncbi:ABC transporter ATP-binding protein [Nitrosomonas mobilis]|uniref:ABC transporter related protein n=1 Tax=Nitrosomonas mobilis TaxID=51642 RepID=A0A1G5SE80_9PROT|nr:ABC transporter ATP-binding protein [Nitrosomonas mobilis]SCZ85160.1 ABC transporter related protein [Nitrosomonas mobilis]HNO75451.1 ABC transporter ATP-binding protein [Nitrosomonas mobilis]
MLTVDHLSRSILQPVSFSLADGECLAVQGPSGSGKSLLLRAIADLDPHEGTISLDGVACHTIPAPQWRLQVMYLPAEAGWWEDRVDAHFPDWEAACFWVEALQLPTSIRSAAIRTLSTGERQRLALARALVRSPRVLMLDEPTSGLDRTSVSIVESLLLQLLQNGTSLLWVTHDPAQAQRIAQRCLHVQNGHVLETTLRTSVIS